MEGLCEDIHSCHRLFATIGRYSTSPNHFLEMAKRARNRSVVKVGKEMSSTLSHCETHKFELIYLFTSTGAM